MVAATIRARYKIAERKSTIDTFMDPARIAELLEPFFNASDRRLTANDLHNISTYIDLLLRWNARVNLTAIRDPEDIVTRHFGESLFAARHLFPHRENVGTASSNPIRLADLGSGAGFPGVPIKLWAPQIDLTLIESNHKKAAFLREVARALTLTSVNVRAVRAQALNTAFDVVTLRAVERFDTILRTAANLVSPGGRMALLIGSSQLSQVREILADLPAFQPVLPIQAIPVPQSTNRTLAIVPRESTPQDGKHHL